MNVIKCNVSKRKSGKHVYGGLCNFVWSIKLMKVKQGISLLTNVYLLAVTNSSCKLLFNYIQQLNSKLN